MFNANGLVERTLQTQKRIVESRIECITTYINILSHDQIANELKLAINDLKPVHLECIPKPMYKLYKFLLMSVDINNTLNALTRVGNLPRHKDTVIFALRKVERALLHRVGRSSHGYFGGIVHRNDFPAELYSAYFGKGVLSIYTDKYVRRTNGRTVDLHERDKNNADNLNKLLLSNYRSINTQDTIAKRQKDYNIAKQINWEPIIARTLTWKPNKPITYLSYEQISDYEKLGIKL